MFSCEFCEIFMNTFFIGHLRTAAFTKSNLGKFARDEEFSTWDEKPNRISNFSTRLTKLKFSARIENLLIISPLDVWRSSKYPSAQKLSILKNRKKKHDAKYIREC